MNELYKREEKPILSRIMKHRKLATSENFLSIEPTSELNIYFQALVINLRTSIDQNDINASKSAIIQINDFLHQMLQDDINIIQMIKGNHFPEVVLMAVFQIKEDIVLEMLCFFCNFIDKDISSYLLQNRIMDFSSTVLKQKQQNSVFIIYFIAYLVPSVDERLITDLLCLIPFEDIFSNEFLHNDQFVRCLLLLYINIAEFGKKVFFPEIFMKLVQYELNDEKTEKEEQFFINFQIISFFIKIIENCNPSIIDIFIQASTFSKNVELSFLSNDVPSIINLYKFYFKYYKYLSGLYKSNPCDSTAAERFNSIIYLEENQVLDYVFFFLSNSNNSEERFTIINFLIAYVCANASCLNLLNKIFPIIFGIINTGAFEEKIAAYKLIHKVIQFGSPKFCYELHEIYKFNDHFSGCLFSDDEKTIKISLDIVITFISKFMYDPKLQYIKNLFATQSFIEILSDLETRSEPHIASLCESIKVILTTQLELDNE